MHPHRQSALEWLRREMRRPAKRRRELTLTLIQLLGPIVLVTLAMMAGGY